MTAVTRIRILGAALGAVTGERIPALLGVLWLLAVTLSDMLVQSQAG